MISRLFVKDNLTFEKININFKPGLNVFTGVSGSGKSILISSILSVFGLRDSEAKIVEADVEHDFDLEKIGIETNNINTFKLFREKNVRYFINEQSISKKNLTLISKEHIKFLATKDNNELDSDKILKIIDTIISQKDNKYIEKLENLKNKFATFVNIKKELSVINEEENKIEELKEFAKFEIDKIESISPKVGEYEELLALKKMLSKKEKITQAWDKVEDIFKLEQSVVYALSLSEIDSSFFEDCMNELRSAKENLNIEELENLDIENILDRIEQLSSLNKKYGSIELAKEALQKRKKELEHYEQITFEKANLNKNYHLILDEIFKLSQEISKNRIDIKKKIEDIISNYSNQLYMPKIELNFTKSDFKFNGFDEVNFSINATEIKYLSSGELNRLKLAFIATEVEILNFGNGVIMLDEIDANLSGKEAMGIAEVLLKISKFYQIFAISHQPQLSSKANSHFLVSKENEKSFVKELNEDEKVMELARMISGKTITKEALEFARKLRN